MAKLTQDGLAGISPQVLAGYEPVVGLEVHVQLKTATKAFWACRGRCPS
jgi:aspartyl-tRNA(Asn)/glutamyl-tRNA(Gln) amidotransferase subunit B